MERWNSLVLRLLYPDFNNHRVISLSPLLFIIKAMVISEINACNANSVLKQGEAMVINESPSLRVIKKLLMEQIKQTAK